MLRSMHDLENYSIAATDGNIGKVADFLFDDKAWVVRYFVVETGSWLSSRKVLISPIGIQKPNWREKVFPVSITQEQVKNSPDIDTDKTVYRQNEINLLEHYGYPNYWGDIGIWGGGMYPHLLNPGFGQPSQTPQQVFKKTLAHGEANSERHKSYDPNLRSSKAIIGYHIHAIDGDIGHVSGVLIEDNSMVVRYLVVETTNWFGGKQALISPEWIDDIAWLDNSVTINLTCEQIKEAPEYQPSLDLSRDSELALYNHYGFSNYWDIF
tara:strand:+ start:34895 stop:35695 length:801 start_codon:yes stop_codon:yes gene_type:complete